MEDQHLEITLQDALTMRYVPLDTALRWEVNPKRHDLPKIADSIRRHGFKDPPKFEPALNDGRGGIVEGNGRMEALEDMYEAGEPPPRGIGTDSDGRWWVPVLFGVDAASQAEAASYGIDHNWLTVAPLGPEATVGMFDVTIMAAIAPTLPPGLQPIALGGVDLVQLLTTREEEPFEKSTGDNTVKLRLTMADPETQVEHGQVFELGGRHILVVVDVVLEVNLWLPWLEQIRTPAAHLINQPVLFCPYPDPFAPIGLRGEEETMLLIQPDPFIAGHLLDQYKRLHGGESVVQLA